MATLSGHIPRLADTELGEASRGQMAVLIEGAKGVGKTEAASHQAGSRVLLDVDQEARTAAEIDPSLVLAGDKPRLIDEWQEVPSIWNDVRRAVGRPRRTVHPDRIGRRRRPPHRCGLVFLAADAAEDAS